MRTVDEVKSRCFVEDDSACWLWRGAMSGSLPRIYGPDHTATKAALTLALESAPKTDHTEIEATFPVAMASQPGRRAVWHMANGKALPKGWRVYGTCREDCCLNPEHSAAGPTAHVGLQTVKTGRFKNCMPRILANRAIGRARSKLNADLIQEIQQSSETGQDIAARLNLGQSLVSRVRVHGVRAHQPVGGMFSGLMR